MQKINVTTVSAVVTSSAVVNALTGTLPTNFPKVS